MATISERLRDREFYNEHAMTPDALREAADTIDALVAALDEVSEWISNWSPNFEKDDEWPSTKANILAALARAKG